MKKKERVYSIEKQCIGWFMGKPEIKWVARNEWGNALVWANTKTECIKEARWYGYVVPKGV